MKKILLLALFFVGISAASYSQSTGKGSEKSGSFFSRIFHGGQKPRGQMRHFDKQKKDPNIRHNGTSYDKNNRNRRKVDGDGPATATQQKRKRGKKSGVK